MDYINPFSAMGGDQTIESPFLRDMDRQRRSQLAQPFLDMAQQNQQMDMQKKRMEMGEFASPEAQQLRQQQIQTKLVGEQQKARALPWTTDEEISTAKSKIETQPYVTQETIEKAKAAAMKAQGSPAEALYNEIGSANSEIKKLPAEVRQLYAQKFIQQWQARHPGAQLPSVMQKYDPQVWDQAELVAVYNADFQRKTAEQTQKDIAHKARTLIESGDRRYVADKTAESRVTAAQSRGSGSDLPKTDAAIRRYYTTILTNPESTDQQITEAKAQLLPQVEKDTRAMARELQLDLIKDKTSVDKIRKTYMDKYINDHIKDRVSSSSNNPSSDSSSTAIQTILKQNNKPYEPDKFDYRIGPNGMVQSKPKGK